MNEVSPAEQIVCIPLLAAGVLLTSQEDLPLDQCVAADFVSNLAEW
jgi:hypothetical protein